MTSAVFGLMLALALVLALFGLALGVARRFSGGLMASRTPVRMTVLQRTALGPRQGLAMVRVAERVLVVSVGDGGVRLVTELTPDEAAAFELSQDALTDSRAVASFRDVMKRVAGRRDAAGAPERSSVMGTSDRVQQGLRAVGLISIVAALAVSLLVPAPAAARSTTNQATPSPSVAAATQAPAQLNPDALQQVANAAIRQQTGNAPTMSLQVGNGQQNDLRITGTVGTVLFIGLLAMLPTLMLLMTSFTRVLVVLHFLRQALGTQGAPPAHLLTALALLLTGFVMAPTLSDVNTVALQPWMNGEIDEGQMMKAGVEPFRAFMLAQTPEDDLARFVEMAGQQLPETPEEVSLPVLMSAFATSELRAAFQMGFALFLPFVVIDIVVSAVLTSMGMFMLPPTMVALPCKLLLFVLVDGWGLMVGSLVASFA